MTLRYPPSTRRSKVPRGIDEAFTQVSDLLAGIWAAFEAAVTKVAAKTEPNADGEVTVWITAERTDDEDGDLLDPLARETPAERDARIVARYHDGLNSTALAAEFEVHRVTVLRALRKHGIEARAPVLDASRVHDVRRFYEAGHTIEQTAHHYDVSRGTIYRYMKQHGVQRRRRSDGRTRAA